MFGAAALETAPIRPIAFIRNFQQLDPMGANEDLLAANAAYYDAFSTRDIDAMSEIWAPKEISCIHPGWLVILGRDAVLASYRDIFRNPRQESLSYADEVPLPSGDEGRVFCVETVGQAMLAVTNWFRLIEGRWRLVHHQASPLIVPPPTANPKQSFH
jgi:ketosteroid isomerase-like protein